MIKREQDAMIIFAMLEQIVPSAWSAWRIQFGMLIERWK
jgi:hypothetical protein